MAIKNWNHEWSSGATFSFAAGHLLLDSFDLGQDVSFSQADAIINGSTTDAYLFELSSGSWTGSDLDPSIEVESVNGGQNNLLEIATDLFGGAANSSLSLDGHTGTPLNIDIEQLTPQFTVGDFALSHITSADQSFQINIDGDLSLAQIEIIDSNPGDATTFPVDLVVRSTGSIDVSGGLVNQMANDQADIILTTTAATSDIMIGAHVESAAGSIFVNAGRSVLDAGIGTSNLLSAANGAIQMEAGDDVGFATPNSDIFKSTASDLEPIRLNAPTDTDFCRRHRQHRRNFSDPHELHDRCPFRVDFYRG